MGSGNFEEANPFAFTQFIMKFQFLTKQHDVEC